MPPHRSFLFPTRYACPPTKWGTQLARQQVAEVPLLALFLR